MSQSFVHVHLVALRYFAETVRAGSMRQASEALSTAPSAVNRQILKLEEQLQVRLFDRVAGGVKLTSAGEVLYGYIQTLERNLETAIDHMDDMRALRRGHVRIACEDGIGRDFVTRQLVEFAARYRNVTYSISVHGASVILDLIAAGEVDVGLTMGPPMRRDIRLMGAAAVPMGVVMPRDHPFAGKSSMTLVDLAGERMILGGAGYGGASEINRHMTEGSRHRPFIESSSSDNVLSLVLAGLGLAVRSPVGLLTELGRDALAFVPLAGPKVPEVKLCIWTHLTRSPSIAGSVLTQTMVQALKPFAETLDRWRHPVP
ncbi:LysR family transcriptional regulator [Sphingobium terrigena]|uniref:LysR family transcriptional regulator n=1 Tax=Sphingobium terrigena TaxID=2304063 RepID=A0A418YML1_9SPHN|nr:LysR family transcriptional regulator [Sphingobium terrigena]PZU56262.1 MAG: LysR family transcriptional regulator [Sphingobium sp.]RJG52418.1 LysR family transcriptional regulator [Sphingobium terrigena]